MSRSDYSVSEEEMIKLCSVVDCTLWPFCGLRGGRKCCHEIGRSNQEEDRSVDGKDVMIDVVAKKAVREGGKEGQLSSIRGLTLKPGITRVAQTVIATIRVSVILRESTRNGRTNNPNVISISSGVHLTMTIA
jgi:hypothetical protein